MPKRTGFVRGVISDREGWRTASVKRKIRTRSIGPGIKLTTTSWSEGSDRRVKTQLAIEPNAPLPIAEEVLALIAPDGVLSGRPYVEASLMAARASARAIYRKAGIPEGHSVWWRAPKGRRYWLPSQIKSAVAHRKGWKKFPEYSLAEAFGKKEGSPERFAARILEAASVLESLLARSELDRWALVDAAFEFERLGARFNELYGRSFADKQGRPSAEILFIQSNRKPRPPSPLVEKHLPGLRKASREFRRLGRTKGIKAHLVAWLMSQGISMTERGAQKAISRLIQRGKLKIPTARSKANGQS